MINPSISPLNRLSGFVESVLHPLLPVILAGTMIEAVTAAAVLFGILSTSDPIFPILSAAGTAALYYLPILLAYSVAKQIGCSRPTAILTAAILLHPTLTAWQAEVGTDGSALSVRETAYAGTVLPVLAAVFLIKLVERAANRFLPTCVRTLLQPLVTLAIVLPAVLGIVGPSCALIGTLFADGIHLLYERADWAATTLLSIVTPFLLLLGESRFPAAAEHHLLWDVARFSATAALLGTSVARLIACKDRSLRQTAVGGGIGTLCALPRAAAYDSLLHGRIALLTASVAAGIGGLLGSLSGALEESAAPSLLSMLAAIANVHPTNGPPSPYSALRSAVPNFMLTATIGFLLTLLLLPRRKSKTVLSAETSGSTDGQSISTAQTASIAVSSPLSGRVIPLSQMSDPAFSAGILGQGCAILPVFGKVYAPSDGTVTSVSAVGNSITFECSDGVQLLIHVGRAVDSLTDRHFSPCCREGDRVRKGDLLLSFDPDALRRAGADLTTPLLVINAERYGDLSLTCESHVAIGDRLLTLTAKE